MTNTRLLFSTVLLIAVAACTERTLTDPPNFAKGGPTSPSVTGTSPTGAGVDTTLEVRVFGTNFDPGSRADLALNGVVGPKVRTNSTRYVSPSELVANVTIAADADTGAYDVMVTVSTGKKGIGTEMFQVQKGGGNITYVLGPTPTALVTPSGFTEGYARTVDDAGSILGRPKYCCGTWHWDVLSPTTVTVITTIASPLAGSGNAQGDVVVDMQGGGDGILIKTLGGYQGPIRLHDPYLYNNSYWGNAGEIHEDGLVVGSIARVEAGDPGLRQYAAFWASPTAEFQLAPEPPYPPRADGELGERTLTAISASGLIVGRVGEMMTDGSEKRHSWLWQATRGVDGTVTVELLWELPPVPGGPSGDGYSAFNMNAAGTIAGYRRPKNGTLTTVRWTPDATAPSGYRATELALENPVGDVMGVNRCGYIATNMRDRGIVWKDGNTVVTLPPLPGGTGSRAKDINANGDVVGESLLAARRMPNVWTPVVWKGAAPCP